MSARPGLRRYDGVVPVASIQGTLALDLPISHSYPCVAVPTPVVASPRPGAVADMIPVDEPVRRRVEQWVHRYAQAAVEIVSGDRPVTQLVRWTHPEVYADLGRRAQLVARAAGRQVGQGRSHHRVRPQVVGVRVTFLSLDICEVSFRVRYGERFRAVAARFEILDRRLQCTALEFA